MGKALVTKAKGYLGEMAFPSFEDYLQMERNTVEILLSSSEIAGEMSEFYCKLGCLKATLSSGQCTCVKFDSLMESCVEDKGESILPYSQLKKHKMKKHKIRFGVWEEFDNNKQLSFFSQVIEIYGELDSRIQDKLLSRIHFDIAQWQGCSNSIYPIYHIQVGGSPSNGGAFVCNDIQCISYPRILGYPLSMALFLDMVFRELGGVDVKHFIDSPEWRGVIKRNQDLIVVPFLKKVLSDLESHKKIIPQIYYGSREET